jgi:type II secretory pathway predicted ATPase ExeA
VYEARYALRTRPFSLQPGEGYVSIVSLVIPRRQAENCLRDGAGIVLVTGDCGVGKSAFCADLAARLASNWQTLFVSAAGIGAADELYQSILHQLGITECDASRAAARLAIFEAARHVTAPKQGLLLVVDDAHELSVEGLNELRILSASNPGGPSPIRLILCGQLRLEEQIAGPEMADLNQRIGCHVVLEELTREESRDYISARLSNAGASVDAVFSAAAVDTICEVSAGRPRCLNQLCDHSLLLGYADDEQPISAATVYRALDDLKGLALPWNLPYRSPRAADEALRHRGDADAGGAGASREFQAAAADAAAGLPSRFDAAGDNWWDDQEHIAVIEVGGDEEMSVTGPAEIRSAKSPQPSADAPTEVSISDRYAELDRQTESTRRIEAATMESQRLHVARAGLVQTAPSADDPVEERLIETVSQLREEVHAVLAQPLSAAPVDWSAAERAHEEWDVVMPEPDGWPAPSEVQSERPAEMDDMASPGESQSTLRIRTPDDSQNAAQPAQSGEARPRRYAQLFSRLRWRRAATAEGDVLFDGTR